MMKRRTFTDDSVRRMLCNPAYTGIQVHPTLVAFHDRYDREGFFNTARAKARAMGANQCLRDFLKALQLPNDPWARAIPIHASFAIRRDPLICEEDFIRAGLEQIERIGLITYFEYILENLAQGIIPMESR